MVLVKGRYPVRRSEMTTQQASRWVPPQWQGPESEVRVQQAQSTDGLAWQQHCLQQSALGELSRVWGLG